MSRRALWWLATLQVCARENDATAVASAFLATGVWHVHPFSTRH